MKLVRTVFSLLLVNVVFISLGGFQCLAQNLKIGYIGSLSGDAAIIGTEIVKVLEVSIDQINHAGGINGRKLELVAEDDGYEVRRTLTAYERLKSSINSKVIFMSTYGGLFALGKRAERDGIVLVDSLDCNDDLVKTSQMHTCVATRTESIGEAFLKRIYDDGGGKVGVLFEQEAWFNFIVNTLRQSLGAQLVEVVAPLKAGDYRAELLKLKSEKVNHIVFLGNDSMGRALNQARSFGIEVPFYSIASVMSPGFGELAGKSLNGTLVSNWLIPRNEIFSGFSERYKARHGQGIVLEFVAGPTYDATTLVFNTLRRLHTTNHEVSGVQIRNGMVDEAEFLGMSGKIKMDKDGAVRSIRETLFRYEDGKLVGLTGN